jgi:hypothetical protein
VVFELTGIDLVKRSINILVVAENYLTERRRQRRRRRRRFVVFRPVATLLHLVNKSGKN